MRNIVVPPGIKSIGESAFEFCSNLQSISLPQTVEYVGSGAFRWCEELEDIVLPDTIKEMGQSVFCGCYSLKSARLPHGLKVIQPETFLGCGSLEAIDIPSSVMLIGSEAFSGCHSLKSIELPMSVNVIEDTTFYECDSLKEIVIPDNVLTIGKNSFKNCESLEFVSLSKQLRYIADGLFYNCPCLSRLSIPDGVVLIGDRAFERCGTLSRIDVPASVSRIGEWSFSECCEDFGATPKVTYSEEGPDCDYPLITITYPKPIFVSPEGSYAIQYANEHDIPYVETNANAGPDYVVTKPSEPENTDDLKESEFHIKVAGVTFEGRQEHIQKLKSGDRLELALDENNSHDSNAVKVLNAQGVCIGYIPRAKAQMFHDGIKYHGTIYDVKVEAITGGYDSYSRFGVLMCIRISNHNKTERERYWPTEEQNKRYMMLIREWNPDLKDAPDKDPRISSAMWQFHWSAGSPTELEKRFTKPLYVPTKEQEKRFLEALRKWNPDLVEMPNETLEKSGSMNDFRRPCPNPEKFELMIAHPEEWFVDQV